VDTIHLLSHGRQWKRRIQGALHRKAEQDMSKTTVQIRLSPTPEQGRLLMAHCQEYISTVNVLVAAFESDVLTGKVSTKDFRASLPSAVKNQALRDAQSVFKRSFELGRIPVLKKPICQWNNQNWRIEEGTLIVPVCQDGKTQQIRIACADVPLEGKAGIARLKKKRDKWIIDVVLTREDAPPTDGQAVMGIDLGIKVPAVTHIRGQGTRFFGNGRAQRSMRRRFYSRRKTLQKARKTRAIRKSKGKEARWMKTINHQLSWQIVNHANERRIGTIKIETLQGIRKGTTRTSRGAKARKNNRMTNSWSFYQLSLFITYKAERMGIMVEQVDPAYTSQECPASRARNTAQDRSYVCADCGWRGHRDTVGAINISRRTGLSGHRRGATGA